MFPAELTAVFSNLLTNAIKAAGEGGTIRAEGEIGSSGGRPLLRVQNTGVAVDPKDGEKWFRPFASSTSDVDPALGKGMGLGLTITRRILEEYGAAIRFGKPRAGFAACLEIDFGA